MIANPIKIQTATMPGIIEVPPPRMAKHLQMKLPAEVLPSVRRVTESELEELIPASIKLLMKSYPKISSVALISFVRANLHNNKARVVRTENAWGMAIIDRNFFEEDLLAEVKFVCKLSRDITDVLALYEDLKNWAKSVGAKSFYFGNTFEDSDVESAMKRLGFDKKISGYRLEL
jgi:hypothetical protein